jgi:hypothetical protein
MSERVLAALLASLALMTGGCGGGSEPTAQAPTTAGGTASSPSPAAQKPSVPAKPADAKDAKGKPDAPATAKGPNGKSPAVAGGLTRSTDPDERAQEVQGRINAQRKAETKTDPFSVLPVSAVPKGGESAAILAGGKVEEGKVTLLPPLPPITPQGVEAVADISPLALFVPPNGNVIARLPGISDLPGDGVPSSPERTASSPGGAPSSPGTGKSTPGASLSPLPGTSADIGPALPAEPALALPPLNSQPVAALPPLPVNIGPALPPEGIEPPAVSETIQVTGVAQLGNSVQVIVQLPGGQTRYVAVGDLIANGQVLVKRVERLGTGDPIVILEEEGVEYDRAVGAPPIMAMEDSDNS